MGPRRSTGRIVAIAAISTAAALVLAVVGIGVTYAVLGTREPGPLESRLQGLVDDGFPAAVATVTTDDDQESFAAGRAVRGEPGRPPEDPVVRIGSNTKMFTAVVVLRLAEQGKIDLDRPVATYLPRVLPRAGIRDDGITVRQLLQHTSGLPNYTAALPRDPFELRDAYLSPRDLVDLAGTQRSTGEPGQRWSYSNTNFVVAGLVAERVSGRPIDELVRSMIIRPLRLEHTRFPDAGDRRLGGDVAHGYARDAEERLRDITTMDPSWAWAAGQMTSTPGDLNRFMRALVGGRLLDDAMLEEMQTTVPSTDAWTGARYGLGLMRLPLSCGGFAWGHGGDIPGYETRNAVTPDGRAVTVAVTAMPGSIASSPAETLQRTRAVNRVVDRALCAGRSDD
ncbi:MAG: serine hydrolase [Aeromicrobium erythreum]